MNTSHRSEFQGKRLTLRRCFHAPLVRVFQAWTTPADIVRWWGPEGFHVPFCAIDFRVGGEYHYCARSPRGEDFWSKGIFREIVEGHKIVATDFFTDASGRIIPACAVGLPRHWPSTLLLTVTFTPVEDGTLFTLLHEGLPDELMPTSSEGWNEALLKFSQIL